MAVTNIQRTLCYIFRSVLANNVSISGTHDELSVYNLIAHHSKDISINPFGFGHVDQTYLLPKLKAT